MATSLAKNKFSLFSRVFFSIRRDIVERGSADGKRSYSNIQSSYQIRNITEVDIPRIAEIRKSLKLHDCISSLYSFHKLDPEAIIVAEDDQGRIIGTHLMINFAEGLYLTGLTYVTREYRNNNLSVEMIRQGAVRHRNKNRIVIGFTFEGWVNKLEGLLGFPVVTNSYIMKRHISTENIDINLLSDHLPENIEIHPFEDGLLKRMTDYDSQVANCERPKLLELSCKESNTRTLVALKKRQCVGFGTVKLSCPGAKRVGPLYAEDPIIAEALLKSLLKEYHEGKGVVIVFPSPNLEAHKLMNKLNIPFSDNLYHFYERGFPQANVNKAFAHFDVNGTLI